MILFPPSADSLLIAFNFVRTFTLEEKQIQNKFVQSQTNKEFKGWESKAKNT